VGGALAFGALTGQSAILGSSLDFQVQGADLIRTTDKALLSLSLKNVGSVPIENVDIVAYGENAYPALIADTYRQSLVLSLPFEEGSGAVARDASDYNHALSFDGVDDYVGCGTNDSLNIVGPITVEGWIKTTTADTYSRAFVSRMQSGSPYYGYELGIYNGKAYFHAGGTYASNSLYGTKTVSDGVFHHVVGVYDGTNSILYVDSLLDTQGARTDYKNVSGEALDIGTNYNRMCFFPGIIDEVRIYSRALTASEIAYNYAHSKDPVRDNLVLWLSFDENQGSTAYDLSNNGNNGTIHGASWVTPTDGTLYNGPTWVDGKYGKALSFDGVDDFLQTQSSINLVGSSSTWSFWMKVNSFEPAWGNKGLLGSNGFGPNTITFVLNSSNTVGFHVGDSAGNWIGITDPTPLTINVWYHYVGVIDYSAHQTKLYRNGELVGTNTFTNDINFNFPVKFTNNWNTYYNGQWYTVRYNGLADEVRVYNRALDAREIAFLYRSEPGQVYMQADSLSPGATKSASFVIPAEMFEAGRKYAIKVTATSPDNRTATKVVEVLARS
jgi:hypothetical protein